MAHDGHDVTSQPGLLTCWQHGGVKGLFQYRAGLVQEVLRPYCSWGSWRCGNDRFGRGDFEFSHEDKHSSSMLSLHMFLHHKEVDYELGWGGCKTVSCWEYAALWAMGVMWHAGLTRRPADGNNVPAEAKSRTNTDYSIGDFSNSVCVICWHRAWKSIFMRSLNCRNVQPEHEWGNTTATEGHVNRKYVKNWRFESLTPPPSLQVLWEAAGTDRYVPTLCLHHAQQSRRHGGHDELQMNPPVSVGAEQIRACDWTRPVLHI